MQNDDPISLDSVENQIIAMYSAPDAMRLIVRNQRECQWHIPGANLGLGWLVPVLLALAASAAYDRLNGR